MRRMIIPWGQVSTIAPDSRQKGTGNPSFLTLLPVTIGKIRSTHLMGAPMDNERAGDGRRASQSSRSDTP